MKKTLGVGQSFEFEYVVPENKTVPHLYPESPEFQQMPPVFATGFMIGLMEWTCLQQMAPHLDDGECTLGVHVDVSHNAATLPGMTVTVRSECVETNGPRAKFKVIAHDGVDKIGEGFHERFVVKQKRFMMAAQDKARKAGASGTQADQSSQGDQVSG